jgi:hypothetical protein
VRACHSEHEHDYERDAMSSAPSLHGGIARGTLRIQLVLLAALSLVLEACRSETPHPMRLVVVAPPGSGLDLHELSWEPRALVKEARQVGPSHVELLLSYAKPSTPLRLTHPEGCPLEVQLDGAVAPRQVAMRPWIDLGLDRPQLGFGSSFELTVTAGCDEARHGSLRWQRVEGSALVAFRAEKGGFVLSGRMPTFEAVNPSPPPWGIIPLSPRTNGAITLEAVWSGPAHADVKRVIHLSAAARAPGMPAGSLGRRVLLSRSGWTVKTSPRSSKASVNLEGPITTFTPDVTGRFELVDDSGKTLSLTASRLDATTLDCGRAECHPAAVTNVQKSPMASVMKRRVEGKLNGSEAPGCGLGCHAVGES